MLNICLCILKSLRFSCTMCYALATTQCYVSFCLKTIVKPRKPDHPRDRSQVVAVAFVRVRRINIEIK